MRSTPSHRRGARRGRVCRPAGGDGAQRVGDNPIFLPEAKLTLTGAISGTPVSLPWTSSGRRDHVCVLSERRLNAHNPALSVDCLHS